MREYRIVMIDENGNCEDVTLEQVCKIRDNNIKHKEFLNKCLDIQTSIDFQISRRKKWIENRRNQIGRLEELRSILQSYFESGDKQGVNKIARDIATYS